MHNNKKHIVAIVCLVTIFLSGCETKRSDDSFAKLLNETRNKYNLPALGAAIAKNGYIEKIAMVGTRKFGDATEATINDKFHLGSCTKAMTATLTGTFVDEGKIKFDTTLREIFPNIRIHKSLEQVTIAMLLAHMSGIKSNFDMKSDIVPILRKTTNLKERRKLFVSMALSKKPDIKPGTKFMYGNSDYIIVGAILEKISGKQWEDLMRERIFNPLHMSSAGFGAPIGNQPWPHAPSFNKKPIPLNPECTLTHGSDLVTDVGEYPLFLSKDFDFHDKKLPIENGIILNNNNETLIVQNGELLKTGKIVDRMSIPLFKSKSPTPIKVRMSPSSINIITEALAHACLIPVDSLSILGPAGIVHANMRDWMKFLSMINDGFNGKSIFLKPSTFEVLRTPYKQQIYTPGGWGVDNYNSDDLKYYHSGSNIFNYVMATLLPKKNLIMIVVTNYSGSIDKNNKSIARTAADEIVQKALHSYMVSGT